MGAVSVRTSAIRHLRNIFCLRKALMSEKNVPSFGIYCGLVITHCAIVLLRHCCDCYLEKGCVTCQRTSQTHFSGHTAISVVSTVTHKIKKNNLDYFKSRPMLRLFTLASSSSIGCHCIAWVSRIHSNFPVPLISLLQTTPPACYRK